MEQEVIAKQTKNKVADTLDGERPELPENMEQMGGGPMNGGFPNEMNAGTIANTNEWLVPMSCAGVVAGSVILSTVAICLMFLRLERKLKKLN